MDEMSPQRGDVMTARMALQDVVTAWMEEYDVDRERTICELQTLAATLQYAINYNTAWLLRYAVLQRPDAAADDC